MNWRTLNLILLAALSLSLSLGQLARLSLMGLPGSLYLHEIILVGWTFLLSNQLKVKVSFTDEEKILSAYRWEIALLGWIVTGWVAAVFSGTFNPTSLLYTGRLLLYLCWAYLAHFYAGLTTKQYGLAFISSGILMLLYGLLQYWLMPDTRFLGVLGWDDHYYRLIGPLFDPNFMGIVYLLTFLWLEKLPLKTIPSQLPLKITLQLLLTVGIALTLSRSSYLSLGVGLMGIIFSKFSWRQWHLSDFLVPLIAIPLLIMVVWIAPKPGGEGVNLLRTTSATARFDSTRQTVDWQWRTLLLGEGLFQPQRSPISTQTFNRPNTARFADNLFVFIYNGVGIGGILLLLMVIGKWGVKLWSHHQLLLLMLLVTLVHSMFNHTMFQPVVLLFLLSGGLGKPIQKT